MTITFNPISKIQFTNMAPIKSGQTPKALGQEGNKLLSEKNEDNIDIKKMANIIRANKKQAKLPDFKEIEQKFLNGEIDPRKLKKGNKIVLSNCTIEIEKDGEFTCKVKGRDDMVRIYVEKNAFGQDCACFLRRYKKEECNLYVNYYKKIPLDKYDKKIKNQTK